MTDLDVSSRSPGFLDPAKLDCFSGSRFTKHCKWPRAPALEACRHHHPLNASLRRGAVTAPDMLASHVILVHTFVDLSIFRRRSCELRKRHFESWPPPQARPAFQGTSHEGSGAGRRL